MKKIAITGIIGSGKSTAAGLFKKLDIPVFVADESAKELMENDSQVVDQISNYFGDISYLNGKLNKNYISDRIYNNSSDLKFVNSLVHPKVNSKFKGWCNVQKASYVIYESALVFENGSQEIFDEIICIKTPINIIHQRISLRENYSFEKINKIIENQISQDEKCKKSTYCILNDSIDNLKKNLMDIHIKLA
jgi:dephospho-CoA kinase|tara:strand:+ start:3116 stop:3691 length:576 start_codon:yes stop_codon:yes gene_type:complete